MDDVTPVAPDSAVVHARPQSVLLVEDDALLRRCISRLLELHGRRVVCASDGVEAVDIFRARADEIDVVILDLSMPRGDGLSAFAQLRRLDPKVPVIISSGCIDSQFDAVQSVGDVQGVLPKPYTSKQMLEVLLGV